MKKLFSSLPLVISALILCGCSAGPRIEVDLSQVGNNQMGALLSKNFAQSSDYTKKKIADLVNDSKISNATNKKEALENLGFVCEINYVCTYHAKIDSKLVQSDGTTQPKDRLVDVYDIKVDYSGSKFILDISLKTTKN